MRVEDRLQNYPLHDSMRGHFGYELYKHMSKNEDIILLSLDLGFGMFNPHFEDLTDQCFQLGASEQAGMGVACGLALSGKIPVIYSISPFLIFRAFETIRNYVNQEGLNVKLIGSGRNTDYEHDGFSHNASDIPQILGNFKNIKQHYPNSKLEIEGLMREIFARRGADFLSLSR